MDLAAPGSKDLVLCEKCFAMMPSDAEYCTECGAPLTDAPGVMGSDTEVYPELAKANVLRMRKEFKAAEDVCLAILRRFPNNASSNTLLGDIATERGALDQAVEWYELALDIVPDSKENQEKLAAVKAQLAEQQAQATVVNLGIPDKKPPYVLIGLAGAVIVGFVIAGYMIANRETGTTDPNKPLVVGGQEDRGERPADPLPEPPKPTPDVSFFTSAPELATTLATALAIDPMRIPLVETNGDKSEVRLSLTISEPEGEWPLRARLVWKAFELNETTETVELTVRDGERTITQSVNRAEYLKTIDPTFDTTNEALFVETLLGFKMPVPDPVVPTTPPTTDQITPPLGTGGTRSDDATSGG